MLGREKGGEMAAHFLGGPLALWSPRELLSRMKGRAVGPRISSKKISPWEMTCGDSDPRGKAPH